MAFNDIFKKHRQKMGLSQKDIADDFGVSFSLVSQWERGCCTPNPEMLKRIADYFYISVNELLGTYDSQHFDELRHFVDLPLERYKNLSPENKKIVAHYVNTLIDVLQKKGI